MINLFNDIRCFLHGCFDERCLVADLPEVVWNAPGYRFSSYDGFGVAVESLRAEHPKNEASVLVISQDGRFGFHREETRLDLELRIDTTRRESGPSRES